VLSDSGAMTQCKKSGLFSTTLPFEEPHTMDKKPSQRTTPPKPHAQGMGGKLDNDVNKPGAQQPTQKNEARRTAVSRSDRESLVGSHNQTRTRKGSTGRPPGAAR
jgi:hypothetical protein